MTETLPLFGRARWLDTALQQPKADASKLLAQLETGDLWFSSGNPCVFTPSFLIRLGTRSEWAHVGMVLREGNGIELVEAPGSVALRRAPIETVLREECRLARIVIARPLAFAGEPFPGAPNPGIANQWRAKILSWAGRDFPREYDYLEFVKIAIILLLGGLARRWRGIPILGRLARNRPAAHLRRLQAKQAAYTCAELVAELLAACPSYADEFDLTPNSDDFLSPATIAERIPLVVLGRLR